MNDIEAIRVLEQYREGLIEHTTHHERITSALFHAIASLQAKSDAEVVCEWLRKNMTWSLNYFGDGGVCLENVVSKTRIDAASLADLAKKIGLLDKPIRIGTIDP